MAVDTATAQYASIVLRIISYVFLRWAAFPPFILISYALFAIYTPAFISSYLKEPTVALYDDINVTITDTLVDDKGQAPEDVGNEVNGGEKEPLIVEEVDVEEELRLGPAPAHRLKTLLTGVPSPNSLFFTTLTYLINAALVYMITDFVYTPKWSYPSHDLSFARVGYVSDTEAKLLLREPDQTKMPVTIEVHIKDPQPPFDNPLWQTAGGVRWTSNETDFTSVVSIPLSHSRQRVYEWRTSNNHSGEFASAPRAGKLPDLYDGKFTFLATSCIVPRLPYSPLDHPLAFPGMRHLGKVLPSLGAQFMLFLGDFIYVDVPKRFGSTVEDYRMKYRQVYASPDWPAVGQNLSWIHVLDDHEILNDWDSNTTGVYKAATDPYYHYQTVANPPIAKAAGTRDLLPRRGATYFEFTQGPASFFMLDTRTYRSKNSLPFEDPDKTMLGQQQLTDFLAWLAKPEPRGVKWKIVASSVPLTKNWRVNTKDTWGGFLVERQKVLEAMWSAGLRGTGVVVVSGDRHEFGATAFPPPAGDERWSNEVTVHEFSASPLNQFYSPIGTYKQTDGEDVQLKYINSGNSKFGSLTIEGLADGTLSSLKYSLFIDGEERWNTTILSPPVAAAFKPVSIWDRLRGL